MVEGNVRIKIEGIDAYVGGNVTLGQLISSVPQGYGPHLTVSLHFDTTRGKISLLNEQFNILNSTDVM